MRRVLRQYNFVSKTIMQNISWTNIKHRGENVFNCHGTISMSNGKMKTNAGIRTLLLSLIRIITQNFTVRYLV